MADRDLAHETLNEKKIDTKSPLFMNDYFDVKKPAVPSDYIWESKL